MATEWHNIPNDPSFNKDWLDIRHWFGDKRHFRPWYDDDADYNTNAKSYYDFLARFIRQLDTMIGLINKLLAQDIATTNTPAINLKKAGDWQKGHVCNGEWVYDDGENGIETLTATLILSMRELNSAKILNDGLYVKDLQPQIDDLAARVKKLEDEVGVDNGKGTIFEQLDNLGDRINQILKSIASTGKIEVPRHVSTAGNTKLITPVPLGSITDDTRIGITWHMGSTRQTNYYTVADLKTTNSHLFGYNFDDASNGGIFLEAFTRIIDGALKITTLHSWLIHQGGEATWYAEPFSEDYDPNTDPVTGQIYYKETDPRYANQTPPHNNGITIDDIIVYDLVPIIPEI